MAPHAPRSADHPVSRGSGLRKQTRRFFSNLLRLSLSCIRSGPVRWTAEFHHRRTPAAGLGGCILVRENAGVSGEERSHPLTEDAHALPMNDPDPADPGRGTEIQKIAEEGSHLSRREGVEVEGVTWGEGERPGKG